MLKFGINPVNFMSENPIKRIELSKKAGFDAIEILGFPNELTQTGLREIKGVLKEYSMKAITIAGGPPLALSEGKLLLESDDQTIRNRTKEYLNSCVDWANELEASTIYVCPLRKKMEIKDHKNTLENFREVIDNCTEYARGTGIKFAIEHVPGSLIDTAAYINEVVNEFNIENLGSLLDIGHINMSREDTRTAVLNTDKIFHIHLDNNDGKNDIHTPFNIGTLSREDFIKFIKATKEKNYEGYYSLELLNLQDPMKTLKENTEFIKNIYENA